MSQAEPSLIIESLIVGPFQTNVYVVGCAKSREGAILDAGGNAAGLLKHAKDHDLNLSKILQTHAHIDHVAALSEIKAETKAPIYLHPDEQPVYDAAPMQGQMFGFRISPLPPVDIHVVEGDIIEVGELRAKVMLLPGHSPGSIAFYFEEQGVIFSGDVLFAGSIGRTDLPGGDVRAMRASLDRLKPLPPETRVLSGHGPATTIAQELRLNPFLR